MAELGKMQELVICPKCGESNPKEERHCTNCGARLDIVESASAQEKKPGFFARLFGKKA
jgi:predicted amidophosphoribosyltransferase